MAKHQRLIHNQNHVIKPDNDYVNQCRKFLLFCLDVGSTRVLERINFYPIRQIFSHFKIKSYINYNFSAWRLKRRLKVYMEMLRETQVWTKTVLVSHSTRFPGNDLEADLIEC